MTCKAIHFVIYMIHESNEIFQRITHLRLKSGDAHLTVTAGTTVGINRMANLIWFFHKFTNESRWLSLNGFFAGAELLKSDALLSLTGLDV